MKLIYASGREGGATRNIKTSDEEKNRFALEDEEVLRLAGWGHLIEEHYSKEKGRWTPMDIEWAKDGDGRNVGNGELYIVQARPETVHSIKERNAFKNYVLKENGRIITTGKAVGNRIGQGKADVIESVTDISRFRRGEVLITDATDPDWEPIMKIAGAIVTNKGGRTCHAAIISRELGIPCIVGTGNATSLIKTGDEITVCCSEGEIGHVYEGLLKYDIEEINLEKIPGTKTRIMMNVGIPEQAFGQGQIPCDGVGLARVEFIINSHIRIHPLALLDYPVLKQKDKEEDEKLHRAIEEIESRTKAYEDKAQFFIDNLAHGIAMIGAAFYPNDVIVRLSDFKTNEYANLIGGYIYEPSESNPMIGWRGASRYYDERYRRAFALECSALKKVRDEIGLDNVKVMIPFCRTPEEGRKVIGIMKEHGLEQGKDGLEIYVMVEIPSNVIQAEEFAGIFDGFSIGSNDLTQLVLGLDRDSEIVSHLYDERNASVKSLIERVIKVARNKNRKIGICGQAPSDFPDFARFLVECGIDSISLNPDTVLKTRLYVAEVEKGLDMERR